jgi:hypothetical protein
MAINKQTKLAPAPLKYPNGGGLKAITGASAAVKKAEVNAMEAKHALERAKLKEKHSKPAAPRPAIGGK